MKMISRRTIRLFDALVKQCRRGRRLAHFSSYVRYRLEQYERNMRKEIVNRKVDDMYTPLFYACKAGNVKMIEYLISVCGADVDQTSRWFPGDYEMTPLYKACFKRKHCNFGVFRRATVTDVVKCLVKHGADINRTDALFGRTCLMETVHKVKLCKFFLKNGADVNVRDRRNNKTALHYAIEGKFFATVKVLLDHGADVTLRSLDNYDALHTACLVQSQPIFDYLVEHGSYSPGRLADANELMGSRCFGDRQMALEYWCKAIEIRNANAVDGKPLAKTPIMPKRDCYRNASEFTTLDELNAIALNPDALKIQQILIPERIFGECHRATFDALERIGDSYADLYFRYQHCFNFWKRALEISAVNDAISWSDVEKVIQGLLRALYNVYIMRIPLEVAYPNRVNKEQSRFADIVDVFKLLTTRLVTAEPPPDELIEVYEAEGNGYEATLKCTIHLIYFLVKTARTSEAKDEVRALVRRLVNLNPLLPGNHDTLLHLGVSKYNVYSDYYVNDYDVHFFPDLEVTKLLLECGAHVNAQDVELGRTPLHIITTSSGNFCDQHVKLLLDHGAHLDMPDVMGQTSAHGISVQRCNTVDIVNYTTLRCLAARAIVRNNIQYHDLPASVNQFLDLHREYEPEERQYR